MLDAEPGGPRGELRQMAVEHIHRADQEHPAELARPPPASHLLEVDVRLEQGAEVGEMGGNALAAAPIAICMPAELGLRWSIGTWPLPTARSQPTAK